MRERLLSLVEALLDYGPDPVSQRYYEWKTRLYQKLAREQVAQTYIPRRRR
ncbi:hypothetical protein LX81_01301 [Palleronia aestuarii]|uniref:Uncharacterized protein n=1 Tax=Palleronia aestuarii TaxID=568105 RepID=A0A2W7NW95_9RHOB|nr:hypothetical protein [Palleronia aestuarii]PZX17576.1 hypothetical protein LX81_01301 [Palleronia aestuarii]